MPNGSSITGGNSPDGGMETPLTLPSVQATGSEPSPVPASPVTPPAPDPLPTPTTPSLSTPSPNTDQLATLAANYEELAKRVETSARDMESAKSISYLGFAILLVMVGAMVFGAIWQYSSTVSILSEKMGYLEGQLDREATISTPSSSAASAQTAKSSQSNSK